MLHELDIPKEEVVTFFCTQSRGAYARGLLHIIPFKKSS